jgi:excisionase family DNA binding protein
MSDALLWSVEEAARQLGGIHPETVRKLVRAGALPAVKIGRRVMIAPEDARAYRDSLRSPADSTILQGCDDASRTKTASTSGQAPRIGKRPRRTGAAEQLGALLAFPSPKTQTG